MIRRPCRERNDSERHRRLDRRPRIVAFEREIPVAEVEERLHGRIEPHYGQRTGFARKLLVHLLQMVQIEVRVAERMDEFTGLQAETCAVINVSRA